MASNAGDMLSGSSLRDLLLELNSECGERSFSLLNSRPGLPLVEGLYDSNRFQVTFNNFSAMLGYATCFRSIESYETPSRQNRRKMRLSSRKTNLIFKC